MCDNSHKGAGLLSKWDREDAAGGGDDDDDDDYVGAAMVAEGLEEPGAAGFEAASANAEGGAPGGASAGACI